MESINENHFNKADQVSPIARRQKPNLLNDLFDLEPLKTKEQRITGNKLKYDD